jgi:hypothetical protein
MKLMKSVAAHRTYARPATATRPAFCCDELRTNNMTTQLAAIMPTRRSNDASWSARLDLHRRCVALTTRPGSSASPSADEQQHSRTHHAADVDGIAREFRARGFAVVRQLVPEWHLDALRSALREYIEGSSSTTSSSAVGSEDGPLHYYEGSEAERGTDTSALKYISFQAFNHLPDRQRFQPLRELPLMPELEDLARACLSTPAGHPERALTYAMRWLNKPPLPDRGARSATPPHQDSFYFARSPVQGQEQGEPPPLELPRLCSLWLALDPVDEGNGCLRYRPYSHKQGILPHQAGGPLGFSQQLAVTRDGSAAAELAADSDDKEEEEEEEEEEAEEVSVILAPGDCVLHDGCTIHRADANHSRTRHRRALGITYRAVSRDSR